MDHIDNIDQKILRLLQKDAKITAKEIASKLNMTTSPIYERIKRLEKSGIIKKYVAILDSKLLNRPIQTICQVSMVNHTEETFDQFEKDILKLKEVQECWHMAGSVDFLLKINTESLDEYHNFVRHKLSKLQNIGVLNSTFVLKEIKNTTSLDI